MIIVEGWGNLPLGARRYDLPHLVRFNPGTEEADPKALCGAELAPLKLERYGTAARVGVTLCRTCVQHLEYRGRPVAPVVPLAGRRRTR